MVGASQDPAWTDVVVAWATVATALILFFGGLIAWWQASEARRLRRDQTRPFVVIDFDAQREHQFIYLVISNFGSTLARNVRFEFRRPIASSMDKETTFGSLHMFSNGIPSLPPGKLLPGLQVHVERRLHLPVGPVE